MTLLIDVLEETDRDLSKSVSLAADVARTWGSFLQDVSKAALSGYISHP